MNASIFLKIKGIDILSTSLGWMASRPRKARILTFHSVGDASDDFFSVGIRRFRDFISVLIDEGRQTIRAVDLMEKWPLALREDNLIVLTFDDGYACHRDIVADLLSQNGMTATFFILSSFVHNQRTRAKFANRERVFLSSDDIREMDSAGFEISSHSHTHPFCGSIPLDAFRQEALLSKQALESILGHTIASFSYPYGRQGAYTERTAEVLQQTGYRSAFTQEALPLVPVSNLFELPRINIDCFDTVQSFRRKLYGYYEVIAQFRRYVRLA